MNTIAPNGQVWVCAACGKRSKDRYGEQKISLGWDASCMMNAVLCFEDKIEVEEGVAWVKCGGVIEDTRPLGETVEGGMARMLQPHD